MSVAFVSVFALVFAASLTPVVRRLALASGLLDVPNERSSHSTATPRGGGVSIVATVTVACVVLAFLGRISWSLFAALAGGGTAVATIGFLDDRRPISAQVRLLVHFGAAAWALAWLGDPPLVEWAAHPLFSHLLGGSLTLLGLVWALNLFNFMDGIDGIAASEAVFVAWAGALLIVIAGGCPGVADVGWVLGSASFGFLLWNWSPARIFMGDVGSGYLGYSLGVLTLAVARPQPTALWSWVILGGVFLVDATVTMLRRVFRGEQVHQAHRSHAYQWLARRWGSHRRVALTVIAINLLWLFPAAVLAVRHPAHARTIAVIALGPIVLGALVAGAGRREQPTRGNA